MNGSAKLNDDQRLVYVVGAIVLCCQEIEVLLKHFLPFIGPNGSDLSSILARHAKLAKRPLGEVASKFVEAWTGETEPFRSYVQQVVDQRNEVVHHFNQTYGALILAGNHEQVFGILREQHEDAVALLRLLREMTVHLAEAMRDSLFAGTAEYAEFDEVCARARAIFVDR